MGIRQLLVALLSSLVALTVASASNAAESRQESFGTMPDGRPVTVITLVNRNKFQVRVISLGATLQSVLVPDRNGKFADIVLGYSDLKGYLGNSSYFGATVGRYANRIAKGRFTLDGMTYQLPINNGVNSLHGGAVGFGQVLWTVDDMKSGQEASVTLRYVSPDGDQGYPGQLTATATYSLNEQNELSLDYRATTDKPTIINMSNHAYWNLAGEDSGRSILGLLLTMPADAYTPVDDTQIPTGEIRSVTGTPFDFRQPKAIGRDIRGRDNQVLIGRGYDHNWVIARQPAANLRLVARVEDPISGRVLEMSSTQPGLQFYSGNFLDGSVVGKNGHVYRQSDGLALEPQLFPDTPNRPEFGSARLDPGKTYESHIIYRFTTKSKPEASP
ncbi:MAG TPA: aldose epimerase family protein [Rhizomicrobium sp.]|nr:aldose epimerase family protein [Rhizomicrobium sp.]